MTHGCKLTLFYLCLSLMYLSENITFDSRKIQCHVMILKQINFAFFCSNHNCRSRQRQAKSRRFRGGSWLCSGGFCLPWCFSVWHLGSTRGCKKWQSLEQFFNLAVFPSILTLRLWCYHSILLTEVTVLLFFLQLAVHNSARDVTSVSYVYY